MKECTCNNCDCGGTCTRECTCECCKTVTVDIKTMKPKRGDYTKNEKV
jgi:hypothetical protein